MKLPRHEDQTSRARFKIALQLILFVGVVGLGWTYSNKERPDSSQAAIKYSNLSDTDLITVVATLRLKHPPPTDDARAKDLAQLGRALFFDPGFSANGQVACASCHKPEMSFTDGKALSEGLSLTTMNAPTLVNSYASEWFFWNGRADSLEAQAMGPVEHPKEQGFSRVKVAYRLREHYKKSYENIFGPLPQKFPPMETEMSSPIQTKVSDEIAAFALATLGSSALQKMILSAAGTQGLQPIMVLKNVSAFGTFDPPNPDKNGTEPTDQLPLHEQSAINTIFANYARAIAEFERSIRTDDSPFDQFAASLATTNNLEQSLHEKFGTTELRGLKIFTGPGQCLTCHNGPYLSDQQFHNVGFPAAKADAIDLGRAQGMLLARDSEFNCRGTYLAQKKQTESCRELGYLETENADAVGAFKTPTLRQLKDSAPYGHDGRFANLRDVLRHYNQLSGSPAVGRTESTLRPLGLSEGELRDLEAFLVSLQGNVSYLK